MQKRILNFIRIGVFCALVFFIYYKIDLIDFVDQFKKINLQTFLMIIAITLCKNILMAIRWLLAQRIFIKDFPFHLALKLSWVSFFCAQFLPGGKLSGDLVQTWEAKQQGYGFADLGKGLIYDKFYTLFVVVVFCLCAACNIHLLIPFIIGMIATLLFKKIVHALFILNSIIIALTAISFWVSILLYFHSMDFYTILAITPIIILCSALPISIGTWGIKESATIYFLGLIHINAEAALSTSIIVSMANLFVALPGLICWVQTRRKIIAEA